MADMGKNILRNKPLCMNQYVVAALKSKETLRGGFVGWC